MGPGAEIRSAATATGERGLCLQWTVARTRRLRDDEAHRLNPLQALYRRAVASTLLNGGSVFPL